MTVGFTPLAVGGFTLNQALDAYVIARPLNDSSALGRLDWWRQCLGHMELGKITIDDVDNGMMQLARRGKMQARAGMPPVPTGKPIAPATRNRYLVMLASVFKWAKKERLLPRAHVSPTRGIELEPEPIDRERYLRPEQVDKLITCAIAIDRKWGKLPCLIRLAFTTGLRIGNIMDLRWQDIDLDDGLVTIPRTKNGDAIVSPLMPDVVAMLRALPGGQRPDAYVFAGPTGKPFTFRFLWERTCEMAGLPGRGVHQLRHGCASALARSGANQAQIMAQLGHRTMSASSRYVHLNTDDKRATLTRVFG